MPMPNGLYLGSQGQLIQPVTRTRTFEWYGRIHPVFACQLMTRKRYKLGILRDGVLKDVRSSCMVVPEGSAVLCTKRIVSDGKGRAGMRFWGPG